MTTELVASTSPPQETDRPATRIYIGNLEYKLVGPRFVHHPLPNTVKLVWNWVGPSNRVAKNVMYALMGAGAPTNQPTLLQSVANTIMSSLQSAVLSGSVSHDWTLNSVTAIDNGMGSGQTAPSTNPPIQGTQPGDACPPQTCMVISWGVNAAYRGGKPRTYLPGVPLNNLQTPGGASITAGAATALQNQAITFLNTVNAAMFDTYTITLGTISYQIANAPRPTPLFRPFPLPVVHERLDSQRRRSGKESSFGVA